jgi:hypothetical protein
MGATVEGRCLTPVTAVHLLIRRLSVADSDSPQGHGAPEAARGAVRWCDLEAGPHARAHRSVRPIAKEHRQFLEHALGLEREDYLRMRIAHRLGFRAAPV